MRFIIGPFNANDQSVPVRFVDGDFDHRRSVKAVLDGSGAYDKPATRTRVQEVALGIERKRAAGVLDLPPG